MKRAKMDVGILPISKQSFAVIKGTFLLSVVKWELFLRLMLSKLFLSPNLIDYFAWIVEH